MALIGMPNTFVRRIHRYRTFRIFLVMGLLGFAAYWFMNGEPISYLLIGPPLYAIDFLQRYLGPYLPFVPWTHPFVVVLPVTLFYFGFMGWLLNVAKYERSFLRYFAMGGIGIFLIVVHVAAWYDIQLFYSIYEPFAIK